MATLASVLAAHLFTLYPGEIACDCEWTQQDENSRAGDRRMIAAHVDHATAAVTAHLAEVLGADATREAVAQAVERRNDEALVGAPRRSDGSVWIDCDYRADADAAIAAIQCTLIGEGL